MKFESLTSDEIQAAMDESVRFALEVVMFKKVLWERGERVPDLGADVAGHLQKAIRTMNGFVALGYRTSDTIYPEVESQMRDDAWRTAWLERQRMGSHVGA